MKNNLNPSIADLGSLDFWKKLAPDYPITDNPFSDKPDYYELSESEQNRIRIQIIEDGYFQLSTIIDNDEIERLRELIFCLFDSGIMPLFAGVYDEFWSLMQRLHPIVKPILGNDYHFVPEFWVWHIDADDNITGWPPHRDGNLDGENIRSDGTPKLCTAWIPLTDVETTNSCMYVLPRKYDVAFQDFIRRHFGQPGIPDADKAKMPINRVRALPVKAGSVIGWDQNALHWGSGSSQWASGPRVSIGLYYQSDDTDIAGWVYDSTGNRHINYNTSNDALTFQQRLTIIANSLEIYGNRLDSKSVHEPHYNDETDKFRHTFKWQA